MAAGQKEVTCVGELEAWRGPGLSAGNAGGGGGSGDLNRGPYWAELSREPTSQVALASESLPTHPLTQKLRSAPGNEYHFTLSMQITKGEKRSIF